jgi:O-antigen/teichoic acid export membrane protein
LYKPEYAETGVLLRIMCFTPVLHALGMCFGNYFMLAFGYQKEWAKIITRMVVLNFALVFPLLLLMRADRAVALSTTLTDLFSAGSSAYFYWKTSSRLMREETEMAVAEVLS